MNDLERAKHMLAMTPRLSCVLCKGDDVYTSEKRGIAPMMDFLDAGYGMAGFCAADRIVGRAAAMLFVLARVDSVYAEVMSEGALEILQMNGINAFYGCLTSYIVNRQGNGQCPMEEAVGAISDPSAAREAIRRTMQKLKARGGSNTGEIQ